MNATLNVAIAAEFELSEKIAETLEESQLNISQLSIVEIYPFNEEQGIRFHNKSVVQLKPEEVEWSSIHYLFFAGDIQQVAHLAKAAEMGCVVIDMKGICASLQDVPVVIPGVNQEKLVDLRQRNIVSLADPQVTQLALAIAPLMSNHEIKDIAVTSLLPASYTNGETVSKLAGQTARLLNGIPLDEGEQRLAFDVFPTPASHLNTQIHKIFPQLDNVVFHSIQVPVFYGMGQMVSVLSDYALAPQSCLASWADNPLMTYHAEKYCTPVTNGEQEMAEEQAAKLHISGLSAVENGLQFWSVADEQRFNLALLSVTLAELIYSQGY
ncbi:oxidoreductase [Pasteurella multocida]|uniref:Usg1 n=1 Tax=Pasteurella multocida (strain Pm70) TaxID=272843 RepID=Q9CNE6_PASMU|nr:oxidoreductase [Pasteurella multocida]AAK02570.1 Usg1 [Pasteurella multocida subsp. multocida str. Pm70]APW55093.1 aspartate-semialdehyde dehydrogenase family protein [Pasteurella multocida subsp. multocida str. HN07]ARA69343.1 aspartate-semialdehyde dehydrogenase [Pasteurella multocida subsp. multocida]ARA88844.1 aspartate-semialdehyde dehydrogenase [Pasteurella multocida subsp. septica]AUL53151.1 aspartate-semialdehyde dehydrogenase [Pasteurella multocida]